jgi:hypothetical protein
MSTMLWASSVATFPLFLLCNDRTGKLAKAFVGNIGKFQVF